MDKPFICGICEKKARSERGLSTHASTYHRGQPRAKWQPGWEPKVRERKERLHGVLIQSPTTGERVPVAVAMSHRSYSAILKDASRPKTVADEFTSLPWPKMPKDAEASDSVAVAIGKTLRTLKQSDPAFDILLSLRDYYLAYGARMRRQKVVA